MACVREEFNIAISIITLILFCDPPSPEVPVSYLLLMQLGKDGRLGLTYLFNTRIINFCYTRRSTLPVLGSLAGNKLYLHGIEQCGLPYTLPR